MHVRANAVSFSYGRRQVLHEVSFSVDRGEWVSVIGPNGAGKTTLLRVLIGLLRPASGEIEYDGTPLRGLSRHEISRRVALLSQHAETPHGFSVREVVATGRTPHLGRLQPMGDGDVACIERALEETGLTHLAGRSIGTLSGGEVQRVFLARAFAQDTPLLALDEPTTNLDLYHERALLDHVRERQRRGTTVVAVLHNLNLAARYSDRIVMLDQGRIVGCGAPHEVLTSEKVSEVFRVDTQIEQIGGQMRVWV